jgi:hypothetical protein
LLPTFMLELPTFTLFIPTFMPTMVAFIFIFLDFSYYFLSSFLIFMLLLLPLCNVIAYFHVVGSSFCSITSCFHIIFWNCSSTYSFVLLMLILPLTFFCIL